MTEVMEVVRGMVVEETEKGIKKIEEGLKRHVKSDVEAVVGEMNSKAENVIKKTDESLKLWAMQGRRPTTKGNSRHRKLRCSILCGV